MTKSGKTCVAILVILAGISYFGYIGFICQLVTDTPDRKIDFHLGILNAVSGFASAFVAFVGLFFTFRAIKESTKSSRLQSTIQLVTDLNADSRLQKTKSLMFAKSESNHLTHYYCELVAKLKNNPTDEETEKSKEDLLYVLNRYEFISLGIRKNAIDEDIFKYLQHANIMKLWKAVKPLVEEMRTSNNGKKTFYQEIELLAKEWDANPIEHLIK